MDNFQNFPVSLAVGAFSTFCALVVGYTSFFYPMLRRASVWTTGPKGTVTLVLLSAALFGAGMLVEDLSDKFSDRDRGIFSLIPMLESQEDLRLGVLFNLNERAEDSWKATPLAEELASRGLITRYALPGSRRTAERLEQAVLRQPDSIVMSKDNLTVLTEQIYFFPSKNTVYLQNESELKLIQLRIDFARSIAFTACWATIVAAILIPVHWLALWLLSLGTSRYPWCEKALLLIEVPWRFPLKSLELDLDALPIRRRSRMVGRCLVVTAGFGLIWGLARVAFAKEEHEFNSRAYGYFVTMSDQDLPKMTLSGPAAGSLPAGISGLTLLADGHTVLAAHDSKAEGEPRFSILTWSPTGNMRVEGVAVAWNGMEPATDVEAVCTVPHRPGMFLAAEGGGWNKKPGRLFGFRLQRDPVSKVWKAEAKNHWLIENAPGEGGSPSDRQVEGICCVEHGSQFLLLIARRGGAEYDKGKVTDIEDGELEWAWFSPTSNMTLKWESRTLKLPAHVQTRDDQARRCSELMVDAQKTVSAHAPLWGVATFENEDDPAQPLRSYLWCIPQLDAVLRSPKSHVVVPDLISTFPGVKVEGLAKSPFGKAWAIIGTDDEDLGEMVRPIRRP